MEWNDGICLKADNKWRRYAAGIEDRGKGIIRQSDIKEYDALMTNVPEVALVTFYADCVPVFFYDSNKKVIALSHSGWRGTVNEIAAATIENMVKSYNCRPSDITAAIGPSIGPCCFEVGMEVRDEFLQKLPWSKNYCSDTENQKSFIDLQGIIEHTLIQSGVKKDNIAMAGLCTRCRNDMFFSHRGDYGKTGSMAAIMQLKEK